MARPDMARRWTMLAGFVSGVFFLGGVLVMHAIRDGSTASSPDPSVIARPTTPAPGPVSEGAAVSASSTRDEAGAISAAVSWATASQQWLYWTDEAITEAIAEAATPDAAAYLADGIVADVRLARQDLVSAGGRVWFVVRPLAWRVEHHDANRASVSVWSVGVVSVEAIADPHANWGTLTVDLVWLDDGWRVDSFREVYGPTPMTGPSDHPWDAEAFDRALAGFTRMDEGPPSGTSR